jgi:hypothetical protein
VREGRPGRGSCDIARAVSRARETDTRSGSLPAGGTAPSAGKCRIAQLVAGLPPVTAVKVASEISTRVGAVAARIAVVAVGLMALALAILPTAVSDAARQRTYAPKDCTKPQVRPNRIVFACGDFGLYVNHLRWKKWGHRRARGKGVLHAKTCDPDCATGGYDDYRVKIKLRKVRLGHCGDRYVRLFRKARLRFPDEKPSYASRIRTSHLFCVH